MGSMFSDLSTDALLVFAGLVGSSLSLTVDSDPNGSKSYQGKVYKHAERDR